MPPLFRWIYASLWEGSMVGRADDQLVFIFALCHCDTEGVVDIHPALIAAMTGIPRDRVDAALVYLECPDPESRSGAEDGRRLIRLDEHRAWGWRIVNFASYNDMAKAAQRKQQWKDSQARTRAEKSARQHLSTRVNTCQQSDTQGEGEGEREGEEALHLEHSSGRMQAARAARNPSRSPRGTP